MLVVLALLGLFEFAWECWSGAGVTGLLTRAQLEKYGTLSVGFWTGIYFVLIVVCPFVLALGTYKAADHATKVKRLPEKVFAGVVLTLALIATGCYWMRTQAPDLDATPVRVDVAAPPAAIQDGMVQLAGIRRTEYGIGYTASWTQGRGTNSNIQSEYRSLFPVTGGAWKDKEPVRFIMSATILRANASSPLQGVLLANSLPWYLRSALERQGLVLATPYYVVYQDAYQATQGNWDALAAIFGFFAFVLGGLLTAILWPEFRKKF